MKLINTLTGGYPRVMDTLLGLQTEMITMGNAPFAALGVDLVLSGCAVTDNGNNTVNIAPGLMYVAGNTLRFDGASNIPSDGTQAITTGSLTTSTPLSFADGSTKDIYSEAKAVVAAKDQANSQQIIIKTTLYNLQQYIKDQINASEPIGTIKEMYDLDGTFMSNFDTTGKGITVAWQGWALDNGNNGTPGSAGRVLIGAGVLGVESYNYGAIGGESTHTLLTPEMPSFTVDTPINAEHYTTQSGGSDHPYGAAGPAERTDILTSNPVGSDQPHNNMQPYKVVYRVVKVGTPTPPPTSPAP